MSSAFAKSLSQLRDHEDEASINLHIGRRVRRRRRILGMTQAALGNALRVHFQQIQKYECAANRISAARLLGLAKALQTPVQYFYDGLLDLPVVNGNGECDALGSRESDDLLTAYYALTPSARQRLLSFIKALGDEPALIPR